VTEDGGGASGARRRRRGYHRHTGRQISAGWWRRRQGSRLGFPGLSGAAAAGELRRPPGVEGWGQRWLVRRWAVRRRGHRLSRGWTTGGAGGAAQGRAWWRRKGSRDLLTRDGRPFKHGMCPQNGKHLPDRPTTEDKKRPCLLVQILAKNMTTESPSMHNKQTILGSIT
jgi:hypothetical protein